MKLIVFSNNKNVGNFFWSALFTRVFIMAEVGHGSHATSSPLGTPSIVLTSLCAGAVAGALAKTTIAPLDRTKINFQIGWKPYSFKKAIGFMVNSYKSEGLISLWRGNSATMVRIVPYAAIQFTAHEQWKHILKANSNSHGLLFMAGSLAGVTSQSLTYPLDLARARMAVTDKAEYSTLRKVFSKTYFEEGLLAFYKGYVPTVAGVIPYAGVSFYTYDSLKVLYAEYFNQRLDKTPHPAASLLFGAIAGMLGQTSSYPLDIVRRRMQCDTENKYTTIWQTLKLIYRTEGVRGLYKGLSMNWIKGPVAVGISYATYDSTKSFLRSIIL